MAIGYQPNYTPPAGLPPLKHFPGFIVSPGVINPTPAQLDAAWNQIFTVANNRKTKLRPPGICGGIQGRLVWSRFYKNNGAVRPTNPADHTDPQYDWTTWDALFTCSAVVNDGALIYPQISMNRQAYSLGQPDWLWTMSGAYKGVFQTIGSNGTMWIPKFYRYSGPDLRDPPLSNQGSTPYIADEIMMFFTALRDHMVATGQINKIMSGPGIGEMLIQGTPTNIDGSALTDGYSQTAQYNGMGLVSKHCAQIFAEVGIPTANSTLLDGAYKTAMWPYMNSPYSVVGESYPDLKMTGDATFTGQSRFNDLNGVYQKDLRTLKQDNESNGVRQYITFSNGENPWGYPAGTTVLQKAVHILWNLGGSPKSLTKKKAGFGYAGAEDPPGNLPVHQITLNVNSSPAYAPTVAEWLEALDAFGPDGTFSVPYTMPGYFGGPSNTFKSGVGRDAGNAFAIQLAAGEETETELSVKISAAPAQNNTPQLQLTANGHTLQKQTATGPQSIFLTGDMSYALWLAPTAEWQAYLDARAADGCDFITLNLNFNTSGKQTDYAGNYTIITPSNGSTTAWNSGEAYYGPSFMATIRAIVDYCKTKGMYVFIYPAWGTSFFQKVTSDAIAAEFGTWVANFFKNDAHVNYIGIGEANANGRQPLSSAQQSMISSLATAINAVSPNKLMGIMPAGDNGAGATLNVVPPLFSTSAWLDYYVAQTYDASSYQSEIMADYYNATPAKPTVDVEPGSYDGTTYLAFNVRYCVIHDFMKGAGLLSWANDKVWAWKSGVTSAYPADGFVAQKYLKRIVSNRNLYDREPNANGVSGTSLIPSGAGTFSSFNQARCCMSKDRSLALIYIHDKNITKPIDLNRLTGAGATLNLFWVDPQTGEHLDQNGNVTTGPARVLTKPASGTTDITTPNVRKDCIAVIEDPSWSTAKLPAAA